jgi:aryl carrier-like protein
MFEIIPDRFHDSLTLVVHYSRYCHRLYISAMSLIPSSSMFTESDVSSLSSLFNIALEDCICRPASTPTGNLVLSTELVAKIDGITYLPRPTVEVREATQEDRDFSLPEQTVLKVLSEYSTIPENKMGPETTIYHIGLDSIAAVQLASRFSSLSGRRILASDILEHPTIGGLASLINAADGEGSKESIDLESFERQHFDQILKESNVPPEDVQSIRPCTSFQTGIISQFLRSERTYVNAVTIQLRNFSSLSAIQSRLETLVGSHDMLRAGFVPVDDPAFEYATVIYNAGSQDSHVSIAPDQFQLESFREECSSLFHQDISYPPWRIALEVSNSKMVLHLVILHALYDARSLTILIEHLSNVSSNEAPATAFEIDDTLRAIVQSNQEHDLHQQFWKGELDNASFNRFPNLSPLRTAVIETQSVSITCSMSLSELQNGCQALGVTIQSIGQATWGRLLSTYLGDSHVTFGCVLSGRDISLESQDVVFPCITTVPMPLHITEDDGELLESIMSFNARVRRHQFARPQDIQRWVNRTNEALFDTIFAFQNLGSSTGKLGWAVLTEIATDEVCLSSFENLIAVLIKSSTPCRLNWNRNQMTRWPFTAHSSQTSSPCSKPASCSLNSTPCYALLLPHPK